MAPPRGCEGLSRRSETSNPNGSLKVYSFSQNGNENQFQFNKDVKEQFTDVQMHLGKVKPTELGTRGATVL